MSIAVSDRVTKFYNCLLLRSHSLIQEELWVQSGKIIDPEKLFYDTKQSADTGVDCRGAIIAPGFIDVQINGGFGVDFSHDVDNVARGLGTVAKGILEHGVTSFCPTLVSSSPQVYHKVLPQLRKKNGGVNGAQVLGAHVEGPFINKDKRGAHEAAVLKELTEGMTSIYEVYKDLGSIAMVTIAPELTQAPEVIECLTQMGIVVSLGHSMATIAQGEVGVRNGATFITHLFNAMLPFHHRDPGLVGLLASDGIPKDRLFYGIIADGNHTHPSTTRIAYRANPPGIVLVTDACSAMGLQPGVHHIGQHEIEVEGTRAVIKGTKTLCGSVATMTSCLQYFLTTTDCGIVEALEAATLHPAQLMKIEKTKGTLDFGSDADFVLLSIDLQVQSTWIGGECVYEQRSFKM